MSREQDREPLTKEHLRAEQLWFERHLAAVIIQAIADRGVSLHEVDGMMGKRIGFTARFIGRLLNGKTGEGKGLVEIAAAMGCRIVLNVVSLEQAAAAMSEGQEG